MKRNGKGSDALLRRIAMTLPEVEEKPHFDMPSFRVRGKIFATARLNEPKAMLKLPVVLQEAMNAEHAGVIEPVPGYWGRNGATFIATDKVDKKLFADLVGAAWATVAPKSLQEGKPAAPKARRK
jgi:hypothetical protein